MEKLSLTKLRMARKNKQLALKQVADRLGMQCSTIWKYENGQVPITTDTLLQMLDIYEISIVDVFVQEV